jgi:hypothetical protein
MPIPVELDLTSVHAKLRRAEEHVGVLGEEISAWIDSGTHTFTTERNEQFTELYFRAKLNGPEPNLLRWTLIAGDAVNNMRSALEHLVYSIAKYETRNDPTADIERLSFIIVDSPEVWDSKDTQRMAVKFSLPVQKAIRSVQPFNRTNPLIPPFLSILRDFSNADKHRLLKLAAAAVSAASLKFSTPSWDDTSVGIFAEPMQDGNIFAIIKTPNPEPNLTLERAQFTIEIALWHGLKAGTSDQLMSRTTAILLLNFCLSEVRFAINEVVAAVA